MISDPVWLPRPSANRSVSCLSRAAIPRKTRMPWRTRSETPFSSTSGSPKPLPRAVSLRGAKPWAGASGPSRPVRWQGALLCFWEPEARTPGSASSQPPASLPHPARAPEVQGTASEPRRSCQCLGLGAQRYRVATQRSIPPPPPRLGKTALLTVRASFIFTHGLVCPPEGLCVGINYRPLMEGFNDC